MLKFYIDWRPMESTHENRLEVFNEAFTLFSSYLLIIFTEFVNVEERYDFGFVAIYLVLAVCAYNIAGVLYNLILALRLKYLKRKHQKAWEKYHIINNKMVNFLLTDFMKVEGI